MKSQIKTEVFQSGFSTRSEDIVQFSSDSIHSKSAGGVWSRLEEVVTSITVTVRPLFFVRRSWKDDYSVLPVGKCVRTARLIPRIAECVSQ